MEELQIFSNPEFGNVRIMALDADPWFVGKDVAQALGYTNTSKAVSVHVDPEDKKYMMLDIADAQNGHLLSGRTKTVVINESGLYSLILLSKLPKAKEFKRWVTSEVLPAIRGTGHYTPHKDISVAVTETDRLIRCAEIMAGCLMGNRQYVLNILRHIVPDVDELEKVSISTDDGGIKVPVTDNTVTRITTGCKKPFNHNQFSNYLIEHDISQAWLEKKLGCSKGMVRKWMYGQSKPSEYYRKKICEALELQEGSFDNNSRIRRIKGCE